MFMPIERLRSRPHSGSCTYEKPVASADMMSESTMRVGGVVARSGRRMYGRWWTTLKTCKFTTRRDASADPQLFAGVCAPP